MQKVLGRILIALIVFSTPNRALYAATDHMDRQSARLKERLEQLPVGTELKVKRRDHSEIVGELVASSEQGFELATPERVSFTYVEIKSVTEDPNGQNTPGSTQSPRRHHGHFARNALIGVAAMVVIAIIFAAAAK